MLSKAKAKIVFICRALVRSYFEIKRLAFLYKLYRSAGFHMELSSIDVPASRMVQSNACPAAVSPDAYCAYMSPTAQLKTTAVPTASMYKSSSAQF
jgi:hypothetical protein